MKTKVLVLAVLVLAAGGALAGGPQVVIAIGNGGGGWWPPVRPICPPVSYCPPVIFRPFPLWSGCSPVFWSSGGGTVGSFSGFSTVSPVMNYQAGEAVYRVPPPVLPAQPVTVYPLSPFGWRR